MKSLKIILPLLLIITFVGCVDQKATNINEFLKIYNSISSSELENSSFTVIKKGDEYVHCIIQDKMLISLFTKKDGIIRQCTVTAKKEISDYEFSELCNNIIKSFTGFSTDESAQYFKKCGDKDGFRLIINDYDIGRTMIINRVDNEINSNGLPTLKRKVKEDDINRPVLPTDKSSDDVIKP